MNSCIVLADSKLTCVSGKCAIIIFTAKRIEQQLALHRSRLELIMGAGTQAACL
jgi:hypothetical protein